MSCWMDGDTRDVMSGDGAGSDLGCHCSLLSAGLKLIAAGFHPRFILLLLPIGSAQSR